MKAVWPWVFGIVIAVCIIGLLTSARSDRRAYWAARGAIVRHVQMTPDQVGTPIRK